jgi:trehalose 6-phosphate phosphatase
LRKASPWLLFMDFDGTLVPIQRDPQKVKLEAAVRRVLARLAARPDARVYIISGRTLASLRRLVRVPRVSLLGLHGGERPGFSVPTDQARGIREAKSQLERQLPCSNNIRLEDKRLGLTVHYRGATPADIRRARKAVVHSLEIFRPLIRMQPGKRSWELLPVSVHGKGARELLKQAGNGALPIYLGDDVSDESAFAALRNGLTIRVGGRAKTNAKLRLRDPGEVSIFLRNLEAVASEKQTA